MALAQVQGAKDPIPNGRGHTEVSGLVTEMVQEVISLQIDAKPPRQDPLMTAVMRHVVDKIAQRKRAEEQKSVRLAEKQNSRCQHYTHHRHRGTWRHDGAGSVERVDVMATVDEEAQRSGRWNPSVKMKDETVQQILDKHPCREPRSKVTGGHPRVEGSNSDADGERGARYPQPEYDDGPYARAT